MTEFFDRNIVLHTHIEKTAGTTLVTGLTSAFGVDRVYDIRATEQPKPAHLPADRRSDIYVLTGHFHYGTQDGYFDRTKIYLACVRSPLERFRSRYHYIRARSDHPGYASVAGKSFARVVDEFLDTKKPLFNIMSQILTGRRKPTSTQLLASLEANYLIVSPFDRVNRTLEALIPLFGGQLSDSGLHENKGDAGTIEEIGGLEEKFNNANMLDNELYRYVEERYEAWLSSLRARLDDRQQSGETIVSGASTGHRVPPAGTSQTTSCANSETSEQPADIAMLELSAASRRPPRWNYLIGANVFGKYCVPKSSKARPAAAAILAGKVWEPDTVSLMTEKCGAGDIILAGAYFGDFVPALSRALDDRAHLWAFEPSIENFDCARYTIALNAITNTTLMNAGLGARSEVLPLLTGKPGDPHLGGASRIVQRRQRGFTLEDVQIVTVDEVVPHDRMVSILQFDVAGFEQQALAGAIRTLKRCRPMLILDSLPKDQDWFDKTITSLGYLQQSKVHTNKIFSVR